MKKYFCDKCESEVLPREDWATGTNGIKFRIHTVGYHCLQCIIDAVKSLDDRVPAIEADKPSAASFKVGDWVVRVPIARQRPWLWSSEPSEITSIYGDRIELKNRGYINSSWWDTTRFTLSEPALNPEANS